MHVTRFASPRLMRSQQGSSGVPGNRGSPCTPGKPRWYLLLLMAVGWLAVAIALVAPAGVMAHPGEMDEFGGHFDENSAEYHYHRPVRDMAINKKDWLQWSEVGTVGQLRGTVHSVDSPRSLWIEVPYRPAYQELTLYLSTQNRNDKAQLVRVFLAYVSPEASARRDAKFNEWFRERVVFELNQKLAKQEVTVQFHVLSKVLRMEGMVLKGAENVNLWMVLNGWSYYMLNSRENPHDATFVQAENQAKENKEGLYAPR